MYIGYIKLYLKNSLILKKNVKRKYVIIGDGALGQFLKDISSSSTWELCGELLNGWGQGDVGFIGNSRIKIIWKMETVLIFWSRYEIE